MKGTISKRGSKEKDPLFIQMLIESTTFASVVMDCTTLTALIVFFKLSFYSCLQLQCSNSLAYCNFSYNHFLPL